MQCPKCKSPMSDFEAELFSAKKCQGCHGIWFDHGEHETARDVIQQDRRLKPSLVDSYEPDPTHDYNAIRDIWCPKCPHQKMIKMVDMEQQHIQFESCPSCNGVFFDAGEFKDYVEHKFMERVSQAIEVLIGNLSHRASTSHKK